MVADITNWSIEDLTNKIKNIKKELEQTQQDLERHERELERRQKRALGVPVQLKETGTTFFLSMHLQVCSNEVEKDSYLNEFLGTFPSAESAKKHADMLYAWRQALVANLKGKPISIEVLKPLLKKGYVAMDADGTWCWFNEKPFYEDNNFEATDDLYYLTMFKIKRFEGDWHNSVSECGF